MAVVVVGVIITRTTRSWPLSSHPSRTRGTRDEHAKRTDRYGYARGRTCTRPSGWRTKGRTFGECGGKTEATTVVFPFSRSLAPSPSIRYFSLSPSLSGSPRPPARAHRFASARPRSAPDPSPPFPPPPARPFPLPNPRSFVCSLSFFLSRPSHCQVVVPLRPSASR